MLSIFKSLKNMFFTTFKFSFYVIFFFLFTFFVFIFTVINVTNFNVWIIKILVLSPKQSKRMFFRQNLFSDCCSLLNQGGPKWFFPCRKGRGYKVFPYWQNAGSPHPQVKNLLTLPHLESRPPPPPNSYSLPTFGKSLISGVLSQFFCHDS